MCRHWVEQVWLAYRRGEIKGEKKALHTKSASMDKEAADKKPVLHRPGSGRLAPFVFRESLCGTLPSSQQIVKTDYVPWFSFISYWAPPPPFSSATSTIHSCTHYAPFTEYQQRLGHYKGVHTPLGMYSTLPPASEPLLLSFSSPDRSTAFNYNRWTIMGKLPLLAALSTLI